MPLGASATTPLKARIRHSAMTGFCQSNQTTGVSGSYAHRIQAFVVSPGLHFSCVWTVLAVHEVPDSTRKRLI